MRTCVRPLLQLALAAACWASTAAHADVALASESADVLPTGQCQIETAVAHASRRGEPGLRLWDALGACGLTPNAQAALGVSGEHPGSQSLKAWRIVGKTLLSAAEPGHTGWGLRYGLEAERGEGGGWQAETLELLVVATRELAPGLLGHANLAHRRSRSAGRHSTGWSFGVETVADLSLAADVYGDDRNRHWASVGVGRRLGRVISLSANAAVQFDRPRTRLLSMGAQFDF